MKIRWSALARGHLDEAYDYIAMDNPEAAELQVRLIAQAVAQLSDFPAMGRSGRLVDTRELVIAGTSYVAVYRVSSDRVDVLALIHGAQQWPKVLSTPS